MDLISHFREKNSSFFFTKEITTDGSTTDDDEDLFFREEIFFKNLKNANEQIINGREVSKRHVDALLFWWQKWLIFQSQRKQPEFEARRFFLLFCENIRRIQYTQSEKICRQKLHTTLDYKGHHVSSEHNANWDGLRLIYSLTLFTLEQFPALSSTPLFIDCLTTWCNEFKKKESNQFNYPEEPTVEDVLRIFLVLFLRHSHEPELTECLQKLAQPLMNQAKSVLGCESVPEDTRCAAALLLVAVAFFVDHEQPNARMTGLEITTALWTDQQSRLSKYHCHLLNLDKFKQEDQLFTEWFACLVVATCSYFCRHPSLKHEPKLDSWLRGIRLKQGFLYLSTSSSPFSISRVNVIIKHLCRLYTKTKSVVTAACLRNFFGHQIQSINLFFNRKSSEFSTQTSFLFAQIEQKPIVTSKLNIPVRFLHTGIIGLKFPNDILKKNEILELALYALQQLTFNFPVTSRSHPLAKSECNISAIKWICLILIDGLKGEKRCRKLRFQLGSFLNKFVISCINKFKLQNKHKKQIISRLLFANPLWNLFLYYNKYFEKLTQQQKCTLLIAKHNCTSVVKKTWKLINYKNYKKNTRFQELQFIFTILRNGDNVLRRRCILRRKKKFHKMTEKKRKNMIEKTVYQSNDVDVKATQFLHENPKDPFFWEYLFEPEIGNGNNGCFCCTDD